MELTVPVRIPVGVVAQTHGNINNIARLEMACAVGGYQLGCAVGQPAEKVMGGTPVRHVVCVLRLIETKLGKEEGIVELLVIHITAPAKIGENYLFYVV